jgi:uroporphyrinogen decarboxylase
MSPRDRVLTALHHERPDRTPCDFWAEPPALERLYAHLGYRDLDRLRARLEVDIVHLDASGPPARSLPGGVYENFWGERFIQQPTPWGPMREDLPGALAQAAHLDDLAAFAWPDPDAIDRSGLASQCSRYSQHALLYGFADVWQRPALVRGWELFFVDLAERPDWVHFLCRKFTDFYLEDYTRAAEATGGRIDLFLLISDLGSQRGPLISRDTFRRFAAPYLREVIDRIHDLGARVLFHSCGAIGSFIPDLIELGVDLLDPIQPTGPDMQPESLHAAFAGRIAFHGGLDMQHLLPQATPGEIAAQVRRYCQSLGTHGGYVLGPAHLFQPDVPPENILAVYDPDLRS